jgi:hypothetical protein
MNLRILKKSHNTNEYFLYNSLFLEKKCFVINIIKFSIQIML